MVDEKERPDDSPVTWRELREAVNAVVDFQMKIMVMSTKTLRHGREAAADEEKAVLEVAEAIERTYKLDELGK